MIWIAFKLVVTLALSVAMGALCRMLVIYPLAPVFLVFWGCICFFFGNDVTQLFDGKGKEHTGRMKKMAWLWKLAGAVSWTLAVGTVLYLF